MTTARRGKKKSAYIICVDVPCHVSVRNKLSVNVASDFTVPPAAVDVNYTDHVPLRAGRESERKYLIIQFNRFNLYSNKSYKKLMTYKKLFI